MTARFNPPPGWQVPAGFRPEPGWAPAPAWPPAPAGWEYWLEESEATTVLTTAAAAPAGLAPEAMSAAERTTLMAPVPAGAGSDGLREPLSLATVAPPPPPSAAPAPAPKPPAGAPRTRSIARQGAAVPLPSGPLGHLRGLDAGTIAAAGPVASDAPPPGGGSERRGGKGAGQYLIPGVAIACFAFGVIIGVMTSVGQASDASQVAADARRAQERVLEDREELDIQRDVVKQAEDALTEREAGLKQRETAVAQAEADLATQQQQLDQQQAAAAAQPRNDGAGFGGFQTCDQLRQSGVQTPVKKGDPGYSRILDLDGNDWACE